MKFDVLRKLFVLAAGAVAFAQACGDEGDVPLTAAERTVTPPPAATSPPSASDECIPQPGCQDVEIPFLSLPACCSAKTACGYEAPPIDDETRMLYPGGDAFFANLTKDDPKGRCIPSWFFFGPRPGVYEHRVDVEDGGTILVTPECESYTLLAFILSGCCLPNNTCAYSTDESASTFESLADGQGAGLAKQQCAPAVELNRQFRESVALEDFAVIPDASGTCDYAALKAKLPVSEWSSP